LVVFKCLPEDPKQKENTCALPMTVGGARKNCALNLKSNKVIYWGENLLCAGKFFGCAWVEISISREIQ
jgi:hypothetical protein